MLIGWIFRYSCTSAQSTSYFSLNEDSDDTIECCRHNFQYTCLVDTYFNQRLLFIAFPFPLALSINIYLNRVYSLVVNPSIPTAIRHEVKYTNMNPTQLTTTPKAEYALINMRGRNS